MGEFHKYHQNDKKKRYNASTLKLSKKSNKSAKTDLLHRTMDTLSLNLLHGYHTCHYGLYVKSSH